ncbi:MAG: UDP-N-acetylmuramyl peptide synthase [Bifidobacterium sp.]|nr:UDP-N-acetylmuramyl peptide synthase [Bifidobacterium sp.]
MSSVNESVGRRMTLGYFVEHYGFDLEPKFATDVTITALADDMDSVRPGCLYIPMNGVDGRRLEQARSRGAYAALVPHALRQSVSQAQFPVLFADPDDAQLGAMASDIAANPSNALAVFALCGADADEVQASVVRLADFLHMLGNPVGVISAAGSTSLERQLELTHPIGIFDVQHTLSVCGEDGAAAVIIALDSQTLRTHALESVGVDVLGSVEDVPPAGTPSSAVVAEQIQRYGFATDKQLRLTIRSEESDALASLSSLADDDASVRRLSLAIAMVLAAGVRRGNIRSALRVSRELG